MTRTDTAHALLELVSRHMVAWAPGSWGPTGWQRVDGVTLAPGLHVVLTQLNVGGLIAIDPRTHAHKYWTPRPARLTDEGNATLQRWDLLKVRVG